MSNRRFLLLIVLLIIFSKCFAQSYRALSVWKKIEISIQRQEDVEVNLRRLSIIKQDAQKNNVICIAHNEQLLPINVDLTNPVINIKM